MSSIAPQVRGFQRGDSAREPGVTLDMFVNTVLISAGCHAYHDGLHNIYYFYKSPHFFMGNFRIFFGPLICFFLLVTFPIFIPKFFASLPILNSSCRSRVRWRPLFSIRLVPCSLGYRCRSAPLARYLSDEILSAI